MSTRSVVVIVIGLIALFVVSCSSSVDSTATAETETPQTSTTEKPAPSSTTSMLSGTPEERLGTVDAFDEMVASGAEVQEFTPEELAEFEFVVEVRDFLEAGGSDDFTRWMETWVELDQKDQIVVGLVDMGRTFCTQAAAFRAEGQSSEDVATWMLAQASLSKEWPDLVLVSYLASVYTLCPELDSFIAEGLRTIEGE